MATSEEKIELVETLKGPRFYRIRLWGYGGESAYINISKEAYSFWKPLTEENGDSDIVNYMVSAEDGDYEFESIEDLPEDAMFLHSKEDGEIYGHPWYEAPGEFCHQHGVAYDNARISVDEVDSEEYNANCIVDVIDSESLSDAINTLEEESNYELSLTEMLECETFGAEEEYVCQFYSAEKGTFFEGILETHGEFDFKKLTVVINEYPNGEDSVVGLQYDGVDVDNQGGDTNGKGYSVYFWKNEQ